MTLFIIFLFIVIFLPLCCLSLALFEKKRAKEKFSFRSYFSFELFPSKGKKDFLLIRIFQGIAFSVGGLPALYAILSSPPSSSLEGSTLLFLITILFVGFLSGIGQFCLSFYDLSYAKRHLVLFFLSSASTILFAGMAGLYFVAAFRNNSEYVALLVLAILLFAISLFVVLLLINPKIADWGKLEKNVDEKGNVSYVRPKWFVLPFSEWSVYFSSLIADIIVLVGFFLMSIK